MPIEQSRTIRTQAEKAASQYSIKRFKYPKDPMQGGVPTDGTCAWVRYEVDGHLVTTSAVWIEAWESWALKGDLHTLLHPHLVYEWVGV